MKIKPYLPAFCAGSFAVIILTASLNGFVNPAKAQQQERQIKPEVVYLRGYESSFASTNGNLWGYNGLKLLNADSSSGAPQFQGAVVMNGAITNQPISLAQAMADLMNQGYTPASIDLTSQYAPQVMMIKGSTALNSHLAGPGLSR